MQNFDALIRERVAQGCSMEEIAQEINKVMNAVEQEEEEKKRKASYARRKIEECGIRITDRFFEENVFGIEANFDIEDATDFIIFALDNPEWTEEQINTFEKVIRDYLDILLTLVTKGPETTLQNIFSQWFEELKGTMKKTKKEETSTTANKSKNEDESPDYKAIKSFLDSLF